MDSYSESKSDCDRNRDKSILPMPALLEPEPRQDEIDKQHDNDDLLDSSSCNNNHSKARNHLVNEDIDSDDDEEDSCSDMPPLDHPPSNSFFFFEDEEEEEENDMDNYSLDSDEIEYYGNKTNFMNFMSKKNAEDALRFCRCPEHGDDDYTYDEENDDEEDEDDDNDNFSHNNDIDKEDEDEDEEALAEEAEECYRRSAVAHISLRPTYLPDSDDDDYDNEWNYMDFIRQRNAQNDAFIHGCRSRSTNPPTSFAPDLGDNDNEDDNDDEEENDDDEAIAKVAIITAIAESLRSLGVTHISLQPNYTVDSDNLEDVFRFHRCPDHGDDDYTYDEEDNDDKDDDENDDDDDENDDDENDNELEEEYYRRLIAAGVSLRFDDYNSDPDDDDDDDDNDDGYEESDQNWLNFIRQFNGLHHGRTLITTTATTDAAEYAESRLLSILSHHQANAVTAVTKDVRERWIQSTMEQVENPNSNPNLKDSIWKECGGCGRMIGIDDAEECGASISMEDLTNTLDSSRNRVLRNKALFQF